MSKKIDRTGEIGYNNNGERMVIVRYVNCDDIDVQFDDGTLVKHRTYGNFKKGQIKNPFTPNSFGVGYIGIGPYKSEDENGKATRSYVAWTSMIQRCHDPKFQEKEPSYKGCTVCQEWHNFQVFAEWFYQNYYEVGDEQMELDKDILYKGNKVYSPDTCVFVPHAINNLFVNRNASRGDFPVGVSKYWNKFQARLSKGNGKRIHLGYFNTPNEAFQAYKEAKEQYIHEIAESYKDKIPQKLYNAMMNYEVEIDD